MSVLHLLGTAGEGGAETYFVDLVEALRRAGVDEAAAIRRNPAREARLAQAGVPVRVLRFGGPLDILTRPAAAGFAAIHRTRVALAWMNRAARHTPRGPWARIGRLGGYYNLKYYKGFDHLVANTDDIADWIVDQGWPAGRVTCIPNFAAVPAEGEGVARAGLDTPEDAPLLLALGRLHEAKAHDVALQALTRIPDAWLWVAGAGPLEAKLKGLAEPLGNVVIQAWAHGLPVVAAESQGPRALIRDGDDGRLVPIDDADALAAGVRELLDQPMLRARFAASGAARVEAEFSEAAVVSRWRRLFADHGDT